MSLSLEKGQKISLTKDNEGLKKVLFGLGWDTNKYDGEENFDLDVQAYLLGSDGKVTGEQDFIFYNQRRHPSGAVTCSEDNRTGEGQGDDETIKVDLSLIPDNIVKIAFSVSIDKAEERLQNFGMVSNSYIRAVNEDTGKEIFKYELDEDFSLETALVVGELYKRGNEWKFNAIGSGFQGGLKAVANNFGLDV